MAQLNNKKPLIGMDRHTFVPNTEIWYLPYLSRHFSYTHSYFSNTTRHKIPKHYLHISKNLHNSNTQTFYSKLLLFKHKIRNKSGTTPLFELLGLLLFKLPSLFTFQTLLLDEFAERDHRRTQKDHQALLIHLSTQWMWHHCSLTLYV